MAIERLKKGKLGLISNMLMKFEHFKIEARR